MNLNNENQNQHTQPIQPTNGTPPVIPGLAATPQAPQNVSANSTDAGPPVPTVTWKDKYDQEHKRSRILAGTTAAACVLALGVGAWGISKPTSATSADVASSQFGGPGSQGGMGGFGGPGNQGGMNGQSQGSQSGASSLSNLFNSDGSVNTEQLEQFKSSAPQGIDLTAVVDRAQQAGSLTSAQASKLKAALGSAT